MKHSRSSAETEIRDTLVTWLRQQFPAARIIHEMNVDNGQNRVDVAAVLPRTILAFEIKSERDNLKLLDRQMRAFADCTHKAVLVAHRKWFDDTPYDNGRPRLRFSHDSDYRWPVWCYPAAGASQDPYGLYSWRISYDDVYTLRQPAPLRMINLLWRDEVLALLEKHSVPGAKTKMNAKALHFLAAWHLTGEQICQGVCSALRAREFAEADAPIHEGGK